ncbi:MAG: DUF4384 domain-containing protein, partial [Planctomycetes bacterium]|nr:DUF4384 domain-containing protein [Planctomycetota bacterium]
ADLECASSALAEEAVAFMERNESVGFLILPFQFMGVPCYLGQRLGTQVQTKIERACAQARAVLSEEELKPVLASLAAQRSDLFDEESGIPALGGLHAHRYQIMGKLTPIPPKQTKCWVEVRIVDLQKGCYAVSETEVALSPGDLKPLQPPPYLEDESNSIRLTFGYCLKDPSRLNHGIEDIRHLNVDDHSGIRFSLAAEQPVYVYLFSVGTSGEGLLVFPNPLHPSAFLERGEAVTVPSEGASALWPDFSFQGEKGKERFYLVASLSPPSDNELLQRLDALERIRMHEEDSAPYLILPESLPREETGSLVCLLEKQRIPIEKNVMIRRLCQRIEEGAEPAAIRTKDLALRPPRIFATAQEDRWEYRAFLDGTALLIEEFTLSHL